MQQLIDQLEKGKRLIHIDVFEKAIAPLNTQQAEDAEKTYLVYNPKWKGARMPILVEKKGQIKWDYLKSTQVGIN